MASSSEVCHKNPGDDGLWFGPNLGTSKLMKCGSLSMSGWGWKWRLQCMLCLYTVSLYVESWEWCNKFAQHLPIRQVKRILEGRLFTKSLVTTRFFALPQVHLASTGSSSLVCRNHWVLYAFLGWGQFTTKVIWAVQNPPPQNQGTKGTKLSHEARVAAMDTAAFSGNLEWIHLM